MWAVGMTWASSSPVSTTAPAAGQLEVSLVALVAGVAGRVWGGAGALSRCVEELGALSPISGSVFTCTWPLVDLGPAWPPPNVWIERVPPACYKQVRIWDWFQLGLKKEIVCFL